MSEIHYARVAFHPGETRQDAANAHPVAHFAVRLSEDPSGYAEEVQYHCNWLAKVFGTKIRAFVAGEPEGIVGVPS